MEEAKRQGNSSCKVTTLDANKNPVQGFLKMNFERNGDFGDALGVSFALNARFADDNPRDVGVGFSEEEAKEMLAGLPKRSDCV